MRFFSNESACPSSRGFRWDHEQSEAARWTACSQIGHLIAMMFPNDKNGMRVNPLLVSKEAAQRSGGLPALIPFRGSSRP
jgi:hypothetical protein